MRLPNTQTSAHLLMRAFPKNQTQLTFFWIVIIKELRKQKVWCDGDISLVYGKAAVTSGVIYIAFHISGKRRADVDDRPESTKGLLFICSNPGECFTCGWVRIAFAVAIIVAHSKVLLSGQT